MVWLHGGGNTQGAGSKRYYDGSAFARDGIVVVTINYRLGPLGFFAHPALTKETPRTEPLANFALMDQLAALRWVKTNIQAFGGDASNVTIFGESAGGVDILTLLTIPDATGLFQKAIVESAAFVAHSVALEAAERQGVAVAAATGAKDGSAQQLRALTASKLINAKVESDGPIVDGRLLKDRPVSQFAIGRFQHVPLMIGTNSDEGSLIEDATPSGTLSPSEIDSLRTALSVTKLHVRGHSGWSKIGVCRVAEPARPLRCLTHSGHAFLADSCGRGADASGSRGPGDHHRWRSNRASRVREQPHWQQAQAGSPDHPESSGWSDRSLLVWQWMLIPTLSSDGRTATAVRLCPLVNGDPIADYCAPVLIVFVTLPLIYP